MKYALLLALCALPACDALPRDPAGTSKRVTDQKMLTVGLAEENIARDPKVEALITTLEHRADAKAVWRPGSGEALLQQLGEGKLDLVLGRFREKSP